MLVVSPSVTTRFVFSAGEGMPFSLSQWAAVEQSRDQIEVNTRSAADVRKQIAVTAAEAYLNILRMRMGSRLDFTIDVPGELAMHPFPPNLLISLVENAIKHGIEPDPGAHVVAVDAQVVAVDGPQRLQVTVTDDGAGLREGVSAGVGLANIRAQLSLRYGAAAGLDLRNGASAGAVATLHIPFEDKRA